MSKEQIELKDFVKKIFQSWPILVIFTILGFTGGFVFSQFQEPKYSTSIVFYFSPLGEQTLKTSSNEFTDTILGILTSASFENLPKFELRKIAPQLVQFQIFGETLEETKNAKNELPKSLEAKLTQILGSGEVEIVSLNLQSEVKPPKNLMALNILVGAALGLVLGIALSSTVIYFRT